MTDAGPLAGTFHILRVHHRHPGSIRKRSNEPRIAKNKALNLDTVRKSVTISSLSCTSCSFASQLRRDDRRPSKVHMGCTDVPQPPVPSHPRVHHNTSGCLWFKFRVPSETMPALLLLMAAPQYDKGRREGVRQRKTGREEGGRIWSAREWRDVWSTTSFWKSSYNSNIFTD